MGAASTAQQNQPVIMEEDKKAHRTENKKRVSFCYLLMHSIIWRPKLYAWNIQTKTSNAAALLK